MQKFIRENSPAAEGYTGDVTVVNGAVTGESNKIMSSANNNQRKVTEKSNTIETVNKSIESPLQARLQDKKMSPAKKNSSHIITSPASQKSG